MKERQVAMRTPACCGCDLPPGSSSSARETGWDVFPQLVFSGFKVETHVLALASSTRDWRPAIHVAFSAQKNGQRVFFGKEIGDGTAAWSCNECGRKVHEGKVLTHVWTSRVEDEFDVTTWIQTKPEFSYAIAVMNRTGGW